jgi:hypothetical protein
MQRIRKGAQSIRRLRISLPWLGVRSMNSAGRYSLAVLILLLIATAGRYPLAVLIVIERSVRPVATARGSDFVADRLKTVKPVAS